MFKTIATAALILLIGCADNNKSDANETLSELGIVIVDYDAEHLELTVNGNKVLDKVVHSFKGGSGISTQFVIKTPKDLMVKFCVNEECVDRSFTRSEKDFYFLIWRQGPIATHSPKFEFSNNLLGFD